MKEDKEKITDPFQEDDWKSSWRNWIKNFYNRVNFKEGLINLELKRLQLS